MAQEKDYHYEYYIFDKYQGIYKTCAYVISCYSGIKHTSFSYSFCEDTAKKNILINLETCYKKLYDELPNNLKGKNYTTNELWVHPRTKNGRIYKDVKIPINIWNALNFYSMPFTLTKNKSPIYKDRTYYIISEINTPKSRYLHRYIFGLNANTDKNVSIKTKDENYGNLLMSNLYS